MIIRYSKSSLKFLAKSNQATVDRIKLSIEGLTHTPPEGDIKMMKGYSDGRQRLRVGKYRIIFNQSEIVLIIDIGSRGDIYK